MDNNESNTELEVSPFERADLNGVKRKRFLKPIPITLTVLFLALGSAALFTLTASAVKFEVSPEPSSLVIENGFFTYQLGERFLMLPGEYSVRVSADGYHDLMIDVNVEHLPDQVFEFALAKLPGILIVTSSPLDNAEVIVDQVTRGTTPLTIDDIEPGLHDIQFKSERYLLYQTEIEIEGRRVEQQLVAELSPAWANVSVSSDPSAANILLGGEVVGLSPGTIEIIQGHHTLGVKKPGYKLWQSDISVAAGDELTLDPVALVKSDGKISIATNPAGANITIAQRYQGQSPLSVSLAPGKSYEVLLSKAGFEPIVKVISVASEEDFSLNLNMTPVMGVVRLQVQPENAELFLDGKSLGEASQRLRLSATRHEIEIKKPGFATYVATITPQPGLTQQLLINLQTDEEARAAAIPTTITAMANVTANLIIPDKLGMGATRRERRRSNEIEKSVHLTRAYYLGTHEITNLAYKKFDPSHNSGMLGRSLLGDDDRPVVNVAWERVARFCNWLSAQNSLPAAYEQVGGVWRLIEPANTGFRLPTEAEWAWAARYDTGGTPNRFPWGNNMPPPAGSGNYADEAAANMVPHHVVGYNDTFRGPAPVGSFTANNFGIFDLNGNVSEWVNDFYTASAGREILVDPVGPKSGDYYVVRGANYTSGQFSELRWTFRDYGKDPRPDVGFRIARYVE